MPESQKQQRTGARPEIKTIRERDAAWIRMIFRRGMRLAYVNELVRLAEEDIIVPKKCFNDVGEMGNYPLYSQWKRVGVSDGNKALGKILKLPIVPEINPSIEIMFRSGYRLAVVQTHHRFVKKVNTIASCRMPLSLPEYIYLSFAHQIALDSGYESLNTAERIKTVHLTLPRAILSVVPEGLDENWFSKLVQDFYLPFRMVLKVVGNDPDQTEVRVGRIF